MISYGFLSQCQLMSVSEGEFQVGCHNREDVHPLDPPQASADSVDYLMIFPRKPIHDFSSSTIFKMSLKTLHVSEISTALQRTQNLAGWAKGFKSEDGKIKVLVLKQTTFLRIIHIIPQTLEVYNNLLTSLVFHQSL